MLQASDVGSQIRSVVKGTNGGGGGARQQAGGGAGARGAGGVERGLPRAGRGGCRRGPLRGGRMCGGGGRLLGGVGGFVDTRDVGARDGEGGWRPPHRG